jgi:hypothetical protein
MVRYPLSLRLSANRLDCQDESRSPHPRHTLLGQALADALNGLAYSVSTEEELALRSQRLDVMIIEPRTAYPLLPAADFRSYAIATHFPRKLIKQLPTGGCQRSQAPGLYRLQTGTREVRLVVINELRRLPRQPMVVQGAAHWGSAAGWHTRSTRCGHAGRFEWDGLRTGSAQTFTWHAVLQGKRGLYFCLP